MTLKGGWKDKRGLSFSRSSHFNFNFQGFCVPQFTFGLLEHKKAEVALQSIAHHLFSPVFSLRFLVSPASLSPYLPVSSSPPPIPTQDFHSFLAVIPSILDLSPSWIRPILRPMRRDRWRRRLPMTKTTRARPRGASSFQATPSMRVSGV